MNEVIFKPTEKQYKALEYLLDDTTEEIAFGGGAGGGKTVLGCYWIISSCLKYPGSRWLIARGELKALKASTVKTFITMLKETFHFTKDREYTYNETSGVFKFYNGSEVVLKDLALNPSDPEFDSLGSHEYCGAFIDEAQQITDKAKEIVVTRLRYKLNEFKIIGKLLICSNPCKNWLYYNFYKKWKEGNLPDTRVFIQALITSNPYIPKSTIRSYERREGITKQRLLYGNWEYDEEDTALIDYTKIVEMFSLTGKGDERYLTVDVARFGKDIITMFLWSGLNLDKIYTFSKQSTKKTKTDILGIQSKYSIPDKNIIVDEDGVGGGIVDELEVCQGFINNSRPIEKKDGQSLYTTTPLHNYANLKSQCYFLLADYINRGQIGIYKDIDATVKGLLIEDLEQIKQKDADKDGKLAVVGKDVIKETLGRSTDYSDSLMMRMYPELRTSAQMYYSNKDANKDKEFAHMTKEEVKEYTKPIEELTIYKINGKVVSKSEYDKQTDNEESDLLY